MHLAVIGYDDCIYSNVLVVVLYVAIPLKRFSVNAVNFCVQFVVCLSRFIIYLYLYYPRRNLYVKSIYVFLVHCVMVYIALM